MTLLQKLAHNVFRGIYNKVSNMQTNSKKSDSTAAAVVLIVLFVIIYYGGFRIHSTFKTNMDYTDGRSVLVRNTTYDFLDSLGFLVKDSMCEIPRIHAYSLEWESFFLTVHGNHAETVVLTAHGMHGQKRMILERGLIKIFIHVAHEILWKDPSKEDPGPPRKQHTWLYPMKDTGVSASEEIHIQPVICATKLQRKKPLVSKLLDNKTDRYYLHINEQWKQLYLHENAEATCCFREFQREDDAEITGEKSKGTPCYIFKQDFVVPLDVNGIIVNCMQRGSKKLIFVDAFFFIHKRNHSANLENSKKVGVLILGIDSLSQINLRRRMRGTYKYLIKNKNEWHEMLGFNKLGFDAFPNLIALLTGYNLAQAHHLLCEPNRSATIDSIPFLWRQVSSMGMPTAFAEDRTDIHALSTETLNFEQPSIDYDLRPFMSAIERRLRINASLLLPKYCLGPRLSANYVYDYALEFAQRFTGRGGLGLFWVNSFRDHYTEPTIFDYELAKYLELLKTRRILDNYVVIFLSGNGMLRGRLNKLKSGFYEERLPLLYISVPAAWKQHPQLAYAFQTNRKRLISPLDLHQTIKHALVFGAGVKPQFTTAADCPNCQSILKPIAANRSCSDAGIDWMWCSCEPFVAKWCNSHAANLLMNSLLTYGNELLWRAGLLNGTCHPLSLHTLYGIYNSQRDNEYYYVKFSTLIANAEFEVALWFNRRRLQVLLDKNKLKRLDQNAVGCVQQGDELLKKICVCVRNVVRSSSGMEERSVDNAKAGQFSGGKNSNLSLA